MKLSLVLCSIIALGLIACASTKDAAEQDVSTNLCVPNQTLRCQCNLGDGTQTCTSEGTLTKCDCTGGAKSGSKNDGGYKPYPPGTTEPPPQPPSLCGNNAVDKNEGCDDGNNVDGDGCSASCQPDGAPTSADSCPGQAVTAWKGGTLVLAGTTEGYQDDVTTSCVDSGGPDRIYAITPSADGIMTIDAVFAAGFDAIIELRRDTCDSSATSLLCTETFSSAFKQAQQVKANHTYFVIVDGSSASQTGAYTLHIGLD